MANKVTIDVEARFVDNASDEAKKAADNIDDIGDAAKKAKKDVDGLGKTKAKPTVDAEDSKFLKKIKAAEAKARKFGRTKTATVLSAIDKATTVMNKVLGKAKSIAGKTWQGIVKAKDSASHILKAVSSLGKGIAGKTWSAIVKIKDYATTPLSKIKNALFSIKSLIAAVTAGLAAKQLIVNPINLADAYSNAQIGFSTLLGESGGQQMMDKIDEFAQATPFKTSNVISNVQKMMAYGWDADKVIDDMKTIGDAAAATGKGDEGLGSIVYALSEIRSKGKLSTQELNQLASAGIKAKQYLAEGLGYGTDDAGLMKLSKDLEKGAIGANQAVELILEGMKEFDGMMDKTANETVQGLWGQIEDAFEINIFRKWGQGLQDGAKKGFGSIVELLNTSEDSLSSFGDTLYSVGKVASNWLAERLEVAVDRINEITGSTEFKEADLGGKVKLLWDGVIGNPFSDWWNDTVIPWWDETVVPWLAEKSEEIGKGLGSGLTNGIVALLGFDASESDIVEDGKTIGGAFMDGFLEGFDTERIGEALSNWASENKGLATVLGIYAGGKILGGIGGFVGNVRNLFGKGSKGGSGTGLGDYATATMNVTAAVVNINSAIGGNGVDIPGVDLPDSKKNGKGLGSADDVLDDATDLLGSGKAAKAADAADDVADAAKAAGKTSVWAKVGSWFSKVFGKTGKAAKAVDAVDDVADVAKVGKVASGASKFTKFLPLIGSLIDMGIDGFVGYKTEKDKGGTTGKALGIGTLKALTGNYEREGVGDRVLGMLGNGAKWAGIGATIGSVVPGIGTAVGAGVGAAAGVVSNAVAQGVDSGFFSDTWEKMKPFFTETIPSAWENLKEGTSTFFDETLPDGWNELWGKVKGFFTESIPTAWESLKEKTSAFFTETIPEAWNELWDGIKGFFTESVPAAWDSLKEKVSTFFTDTIPEAWNNFWEDVGEFFFEKIPYAIGYAVGKVELFFTETVPEAWDSFWGSVGEFLDSIVEWASPIWNDHIVPFFTETLPEAWDSFWGAIGGFFTETLPQWAEGIWNDHIVPFFTETLPEAWNNFWDAVGGFFTETLPQWASTVWNDHIVPFFTETLPGAFVSLFGTIWGFFTETLPQWAESVWNNHIVPFFTETIPEWVSKLWSSLVEFATETIPQWAESTWSNHIVPFFSETIPGWISNVWDSVSGFFTESLPSLASSIWGGIKTFFTETIPSWVSSVFGRVKGSYTEGYGAATDGKKARGGIVGGSSSFEAFARGGIAGYSDGGMVRGGSKLIRVAEEGNPEMIIPLGSQRRDRGLKLWAKAGEMLGVNKYARGGIVGGGTDVGRLEQYEADAPIDGGKTVQIEVGGITVEFHVDARGSENIVEAIKAQANEIAETMAGIMADALGGQFENTPVRA